MCMTDVIVNGIYQVVLLHRCKCYYLGKKKSKKRKKSPKKKKSKKSKSPKNPKEKKREKTVRPR